MRIVIDLDGTICQIRQPNQTYADLLPLTNAVERINELKNDGHYIIISTARNMATCQSNIGQVLKNVGKITLEWLEKYNIPYDEIFFGKQNADVYIDDRALRFDGWESINTATLSLIAKAK